MNFKSFANPILIVGDNPSMSGGLSRIGRDLATLCCTLPQFRVGYLGRGIGNRRKFPFVLYDYPESGQWGEDYLKPVWEDFAGGEPGVIITTDDPSRRHWFANPIGLPPDMQKFLGPGRTFQKWGYFPIDSTGPNTGTLSLASRDCLVYYDRVLAASEWGQTIIGRGGVPGDGSKHAYLDWLPHGIFTDKFKVYEWPRLVLGWPESNVVVGCVMANQSRKDYPAAFDCFAHLRNLYGNNFRAWLHTNSMIQYWNVYALAADYGIGDCLEITLGLNDDQLAVRYSACDCTMLPSAGEGFGYPIAESLACGTSCIVTGYAAGSELVSTECRINPIGYRVDTQHNVRRAVISGQDFVPAVAAQVEQKRNDWAHRAEELAATVEHLNWDKLRHPWTKWLLEGLECQ